jgi:4-hydroxy-2-oxoheptanedioate aldolase
LPEIVSVPGIDVIFIGPTDLSQSYGSPGNAQAPAVREAMQRIVDIVAASDVALGIMVRNAQSAREWQARGARYVSIGLESLLRPAMSEYLAEMA